MRRCHLLIGLVCATLCSALSFADPGPLRIGFIGPLSGPGRAYGEACKNGIELAREQHPDLAVVPIYEDDEFLPAKTVTAFRKLTEIDRVDAVVVVASRGSIAAAPLAEAKKVPLFAWASDTNVALDHPHVVRTWVSGEAEGRRMVEELARRAYGKIAFIIAPGDYARSVAHGVISALSPDVLVLNEEYPPEAADFAPFITKAKKLGVSAIGMCLFPGQLARLAKQTRELGYAPALFGCEALHDENEIAAAQGALEGAWLVTAGVAPEFRERYMKRFGSESVISGAAIHYDLTLLLSDLAKKGLRGEALVDGVMSAGRRAGAIGHFLPTTEQNDRFLDIELIVKEIAGKGFAVPRR